MKKMNGGRKGGAAQRCALALGLTIASFGVATDASAILRYRTSGITCQPFSPVQAEAVFYFSDGIVLEDIDGVAGSEDVNFVRCPIPTGPAIIELDNSDALQLDVVRIRGEYTGAAGESVLLTMSASDYDSINFCTCDSDELFPAVGFFLHDLDFDGSPGCDAGCPGGGAVDPGWALNVTIALLDNEAGAENTLRIKYIAALDT